MIEFGPCDKCELEEIIDYLTYKVLKYENPWKFINEKDIYEFLRAKGLNVQYFED